MLSMYEKGLLYGDGYLKQAERYFFSTTHEVLYKRVLLALEREAYRYITFERTSQKELWSSLFIIEIRISDELEELSNRGIQRDIDFLRGYLETKGTFFKYESRNNTYYRFGFSGSKEDMESLKRYLLELGVVTNQIIRRREREDQGIQSKSYRLLIQQAGSVKKLVRLLDDGELSAYVKDKFSEYTRTWEDQVRRKEEMVKVYKNERSASLFMAKKLGKDIRGIRGGGGKRGYKPVYEWENGKKVVEYKGWKEVYNELKREYEEREKKPAPEVEQL